MTRLPPDVPTGQTSSVLTAIGRRTLWIGGGQWAGKSEVARILASRYPVITYAYDYHDARSHHARAYAHPARFPVCHRWLEANSRDPDESWVKPSPAEMAAQALAIHAERFAMVLDDIAAMPPHGTIVAEGWGLRPEFVAPLVEDTAQAVFLVPTAAFREHQLAVLERATFPASFAVTDLARAQSNRLARDAILAEAAAREARARGLVVIDVDGAESLEEVARRIEQQFRPWLPDWLY